MFILSRKKMSIGETALIVDLGNEGMHPLQDDDRVNLYKFSETSWTISIGAVEAISPDFIDALSRETQNDLRLFLSWAKEKTGLTRHLPPRESIGFLAGLVLIRPSVQELNPGIARDMDFLIQVTKEDMAGIHYALDEDPFVDVWKSICLMPSGRYITDIPNAIT